MPGTAWYISKTNFYFTNIVTSCVNVSHRKYIEESLRILLIFSLIVSGKLCEQYSWDDARFENEWICTYDHVGHVAVF